MLTGLSVMFEQGFEIRPQLRPDTAALRRRHDGVGHGRLAPERLAQSFERDIDPDFAAETKPSAMVVAGSVTRTVTPSIVWCSTPSDMAILENRTNFIGG